MSEPREIHTPKDPLEMAGNLVAALRRMSDRSATHPQEAVREQLGSRSAACGRRAADLALVSIARDLRRIADHLTGDVP
ncbi:hypothetical protein C1I98_11005 [Spongiactinospora gelatinilytica]|uniref:Uncharacterized protein n=1 Tax=Spongiactinospora gelatinilytica TaxID=2666298 RepID=A0A2W2HV61_9ACTN|nr:hypothetical protein [Spongiactinospora gelatinilytica]PZG49837.1 hypothetical protein C1I98_11005 [Spongiactinospora gelatinilytica]